MYLFIYLLSLEISLFIKSFIFKKAKGKILSFYDTKNLAV